MAEGAGQGAAEGGAAAVDWRLKYEKSEEVRKKLRQHLVRRRWCMPSRAVHGNAACASCMRALKTLACLSFTLGGLFCAVQQMLKEQMVNATALINSNNELKAKLQAEQAAARAAQATAASVQR